MIQKKARIVAYRSATELSRGLSRRYPGVVKELSTKDAKHKEVCTRERPPLTFFTRVGYAPTGQPPRSRFWPYAATIGFTVVPPKSFYTQLFHKHSKTLFSAVLAGGVVCTSAIRGQFTRTYTDAKSKSVRLPEKRGHLLTGWLAGIKR